MDAHGVEVLDGADHDAVAGAIAHDLHLDFLPALDGLLHQDLALGRQVDTLGNDATQVVHVIGDAATGATEGEARTNDDGEAEVLDDALGVRHGVSETAPADVQADVLHGLGEELTILTNANGLGVAADDLDAVLGKHAHLVKLDGTVETRLAAHVGQEGVGALALDDLCDGIRRDRLDIGAVGDVRVGHDGRRVGVHEDDLVAERLEALARLRAGVVELARLANDDRTRADDQDLLNVSTLRH